MEYKKRKNSFVVLANQHNPTVFFGRFLTETGIINDDTEVRHDASIITPAFAQLIFSNADTIQVDPDRLKIEGNFGESPFKKGVKYISALPHIVCSAIGINFSYEVSNYDLNGLFVEKLNKYNKTGFSILVNETDDAKSSVNFSKSPKKNIVIANFNFEYRFKNKKFSEINLDVLTERSAKIEIAERVLHEILI